MWSMWRRRIGIITTRWALIAMRMNQTSAETAEPGGIGERPARIGARRIGQYRNRYRSVAWRSKSKRAISSRRLTQMRFRVWVTFRAVSQAEAHGQDRGTTYGPEM
jgi:hypothetical protein